MPLFSLRRNLRRFLEIPRAERRLLVDATATLVLLYLMLHVTPTRWLLRKVFDRAKGASDAPPDVDPEAVGRAVARATRIVPGATCLPQALAALWLLSGRGHPASLRIGVKRDSAAVLAHAWVESGDQVIVGGPQVQQYTVLPDLDAALHWVQP